MIIYVKNLIYRGFYEFKRFYCKSDNEYFNGDDGSKKSIIYNNEKWILKFGKSTSSMEKVNISYTNSPICEYIGSKIYESVVVPVHKCILGSYEGINRMVKLKNI